LAKKKTSQIKDIDPSITEQLKDIPEQQLVVGPLVQFLVDQGWHLEQIIFGKKEWLVPKSPSEQTKREKGQSYSGFPVDIAVFDSIKNVGDPRHLLFIIECKQPNEQAGVSQLEAYFVGEPHSKLGIWTNNADPSARGAFIYRDTDGSILLKRRHIQDLPRPGEAISPEAQRISLNDLIAPSEQILRRVMEDLLDKIVIIDSNVTRREEQLDQLCNLLLLKLESDKQGKADPAQPVFFRPMESTARTAEATKERYSEFVELYPETFTTDEDKRLRFGNETIASCVDVLSDLRLIDLGVATVSVAFQVLRSEALKQGEGQYFTPNQVIQAGIRLMEIEFKDIIIDPACGTGGFLVETMLDMKRQNPNMPDSELSRWAQTHIYGIEKDAIGLKLAKAIMQIAGDGSAHCVRGDSVRVHNWNRDFPHLNDGTMRDGRFSVVVTNPPFGQNLKVSANDSRLSELDIAKRGGDTYTDLEIGLIFLQRAYQLLSVGGRVGIVLPETYFFSVSYSFLLDWIKTRLRPVVVANIPMDAFQGFCRAKTNFYVFEKIG
jgi:type I restriction enzyme M protein